MKKNEKLVLLWVGEMGDDGSRYDAGVVHLGAADAAGALAILETEKVAAVVVAHDLPDGSGIDLLETISRRWHGIARILVTEYSTTSAWRASTLPAASAVVSPAALRGLVLLVRWLVARGSGDDRPAVQASV